MTDSSGIESWGGWVVGALQSTRIYGISVGIC